jgi:hypothetical protein
MLLATGAHRRKQQSAADRSGRPPACAIAQTQRCGSAQPRQPGDDRIPAERSSRRDPSRRCLWRHCNRAVPGHAAARFRIRPLALASVGPRPGWTRRHRRATPTVCICTPRQVSPRRRALLSARSGPWPAVGPKPAGRQTEHRVLAAILQGSGSRRRAPRSRVGALTGRNQRPTPTFVRGCIAARAATDDPPGISCQPAHEQAREDASSGAGAFAPIPTQAAPRRAPASA